MKKNVKNTSNEIYIGFDGDDVVVIEPNKTATVSEAKAEQLKTDFNFEVITDSKPKAKA